MCTKLGIAGVGVELRAFERSLWPSVVSNTDEPAEESKLKDVDFLRFAALRNSLISADFVADVRLRISSRVRGVRSAPSNASLWDGRMTSFAETSLTMQSKEVLHKKHVATLLQTT